MKREIIIAKSVAKAIDGYLKKGKLSQENLDAFYRELAVHPENGDIIVGTGGLRKIRLKSSTGGKRGGFRICYFYFQIKNRIHLLAIYSKNEQEDITNDEKKILKEYIELLKRG